MADLEIQGSIKRTKKGNVDFYYGGGEEAWASKTEAYAGIPSAVRRGKLFAVYENGAIVEYKWKTTNLANGAESTYMINAGGGGGGAVIDDGSISTDTVWSSYKTNTELAKKITFEPLTYVVPDINGKVTI